MDLNEEDESGRQLFLINSVPRDPLVSAGAIVASASASDDVNQSEDLQSTTLAGLIAGAQSTSVCFPTKFSKCTPCHLRLVI